MYIPFISCLQAESLTLPIDSRVIAKIKELVRMNIIRVGEVQRHVEIFVKKDIFCGKEMPAANNRRFFPSRRDIANHIYAARQQLLKSRCDQDNLKVKLLEWQKMNPSDNFFSGN
jgi:hypothetical protein